MKQSPILLYQERCRNSFILITKFVRKLLKILDFLYYRIYRILLKTNVKDIAENAASLWLAGLLGITLL